MQGKPFFSPDLQKVRQAGLDICHQYLGDGRLTNIKTHDQCISVTWKQKHLQVVLLSNL